MKTCYRSSIDDDCDIDVSQTKLCSVFDGLCHVRTQCYTNSQISPRKYKS